MIRVECGSLRFLRMGAAGAVPVSMSRGLGELPHEVKDKKRVGRMGRRGNNILYCTGIRQRATREQRRWRRRKSGEVG